MWKMFWRKQHYDCVGSRVGSGSCLRVCGDALSIQVKLDWTPHTNNMITWREGRGCPLVHWSYGHYHGCSPGLQFLCNLRTLLCSKLLKLSLQLLAYQLSQPQGCKTDSWATICTHLQSLHNGLRVVPFRQSLLINITSHTLTQCQNFTAHKLIQFQANLLFTLPIHQLAPHLLLASHHQLVTTLICHPVTIQSASLSHHLDSARCCTSSIACLPESWHTNKWITSKRC